MIRLQRSLPLILLISLVALASWPLSQAVSHNLAALPLYRSSMSLSQSLSASPADCRLAWLHTLTLLRRTSLESARPALARLLACSPFHMQMVQRIAPKDLALARWAAALYPQERSALFWLADALTPSDPQRALELYAQITAAHPHDGLAWCRLGARQRAQGFTAEAIDSLINCCYNGDPGNHGCWNAGKLYEQKGDFTLALRFYRLSRFDRSLQDADLLEQRLTPAP